MADASLSVAPIRIVLLERSVSADTASYSVELTRNVRLTKFATLTDVRQVVAAMLSAPSIWCAPETSASIPAKAVLHAAQMLSVVFSTTESLAAVLLIL